MTIKHSPAKRRLTHRDLGHFRVVAYNVHGETYGWGPHRYTPHDYTPQLEEWDADVYVIPETWGTDHSPTRTNNANNTSFVHEWINTKNFNSHHARASLSSPRETILALRGDSQILIPTPHPIRNKKIFQFTRHTKDTSENRNCVAALIDMLNNGPIWILGVHLSSNLPFATFANIKELEGFIATLEQTRHPVVLAGDFNMWNWGITAALPRRYKRALKEKTWPTWKPRHQIDHIYIPSPNKQQA